VKLDAAEIVAGQNTRQGWLRAARHQLDRNREQEQWPRQAIRTGSAGGMYTWMRRVLAHEPGNGLYRKLPGMIEPVFAPHRRNGG
jgi:hypothetical protein